MSTAPSCEITDVHIRATRHGGVWRADVAGSLVYPGPARAGDEHRALVEALCAQSLAIGRAEFMVEHDTVCWRGHREERAVDGLWFCLRRMAGTAPDLDTLPSPLPGAIRAALVSPALTRGGLIHIAGGPGCGKTTTGSATVVSRLKAFGGTAYALEDPPELPLNGFHGRGYCRQTWVAGEDGTDWTESVRGALRSQPVATNLIMFVGEVRDAEAARAMLRAAGNGFLVISTGFGGDLVSGIDTFFQLIGREHAMSLASVLRIVLYQNIAQGRFSAQVLASASPASPVAAIIRGGQLAQLQNEASYQLNQVIAGQPVFDA